MRTLILTLAIASAGFGQLRSHVVSITASRQLTVQPDQSNLTVAVTSSASQTLDDILAFLKGTGITAAELSSVHTVVGDISVTNDFNPELEWDFAAPVSFADLNGLLTALAALQAPPQGPGSATVPAAMLRSAQPQTAAVSPIAVSYFSLYATTSPRQQMEQQCPYPALLNDARTQGAKVAAAAGVTLGPIVSLAQGTAPAAISAFVSRSGDFSSLLGISGTLALVWVSNPFVQVPSCTLVVEFQLGP